MRQSVEERLKVSRIYAYEVDACPRKSDSTRFALRDFMTNFFVYMIGVILVVGALAYGGSLMHISSTWIAVYSLAILGLGVMGAIVKTRQKEPS